jgi:hypothetical protein
MFVCEKWRNYEEEKTRDTVFVCFSSVRFIISASVYDLNFRFRSQCHEMTVDILILGEKNTVDFFFQRKTNIRVEKRPDAVNLSVPLISSHDLWDARDVFAAFSLGFRNKTFGIFPDGFNKVRLQCIWRYLFFSSSISCANVYARILLHIYGEALLTLILTKMQRRWLNA